MSILKRFAARLPGFWQSELKRIHHGRQIRKGIFLTSEPEYNIIQNFIAPGDWVVDIGANVGYYTKLFSDLVGPQGRVIAFEPVPVTFSLLAANALLFTNANVTLINAAVSSKIDVLGMTIPQFSNGLTNFYEAHVSNSKDSELSILALEIDSIFTDQRVSLVKIDAEGHEAFVLAGMKNLIKRDYPILVVETFSVEIIDNLSEFGYISERLPNSPNVIFSLCPIKTNI